MGVQATARARAHVGPIGLVPGVVGAAVIGVIGAIVIAVTITTILTSGGPAPTGASGHRPTPSQRPIDPGTYVAGSLKAPARLGGYARLQVTQQAQAQLLKGERDSLRQATGQPAIAASYGRQSSFELLPVSLVASAGYVDAAQYLAGVSSSRVKFTTVGPDSCATYPGLAVLCARAEKQKSLTVVVDGTAPYLKSDRAAAALVDDAWKKLGG
ncbi:MAG: hypothetical protein ACREQM_11860 [Candidatus Dormibacteraceae bacterium]